MKGTVKLKKRLEALGLALLFILQSVLGFLPGMIFSAAGAVKSIEVWDSNQLIDYGYRFGGIETIFKNQKSNGFYIENIVNASEKAYQTMYALVCTAILFLTILGTEYSKNSKCYRKVKIETHKTYKDKGRIRIMSLFNTGLTLFKRAINSMIYIRIPIRFIL